MHMTMTKNKKNKNKNMTIKTIKESKHAHVNGSLPGQILRLLGDLKKVDRTSEALLQMSVKSVPHEWLRGAQE